MTIETEEELEERSSLLAEYHDELIEAKNRLRGEGWKNPTDPLVQASTITRNKALSDGMATIEADGEVTYSNE